MKRAVETNGYSGREVVSGAGHDSCNVATVAATNMIFIPCKDGLSHIEAGANVLLHSALGRANVL